MEFTEPDFRQRYDWDAIAERLRQRPGEWARIFQDGRTAVANAIRQGNIVPVLPALGFEVRTSNNRRTSPRTCDLWMRYNPEREDPVAAAAIRGRRER